MKKIIFVLTIFYALMLPFEAGDNFGLSISLARAKKIDEVINRVNSVNNYINQYILDTGDKTPTQEKLINHFGISIDLFQDYTYSKEFNLSVIGKKVIYSQVVPKDLKPKQLKLYKHSQKLHPQAVVKDNLSIEIPLDAKVQLMLSTINTLPSDSEISTDEPTNKNKKWYKPDGHGGFTIYTYNSTDSSWELFDNTNSKTATTVTKSIMILSDKSALSSQNSKVGDIAYIKKGSKVDKYIYDGSNWLIESTAPQAIDTSSSDSNICSNKNIGMVTYSKEKDCMQRCSLKNNKPILSCIKDDSTLPKIMIFDADIMYYL